MKKILWIVFITYVMAGCNNSAKQAANQQAREKFIADSVTQVIQAAAVAKQNYLDEKNGLKRIVDSLQRQEYQLEQENIQAKASLTVAIDNLNSASEFHLLRTSDERSAQIRQASLKVNELQQYLADLRDKHTEVKNNLASMKERLTAMQ